jgi:fucose permease
MAVPTPTAARGSLLLLAYLGFISLGLPDGLLGVGWPEIRDTFGVPTAAVGFVLTVGTAGYLISSVAGGFTIGRLGVGRLLTISTVLASAALTGYASSPAFAVLVCLAFVLGLGSGAVDSGLNAYAAAAFGPRHMNWLHAFFGLGVAIGPLIMTAVLQAGMSWRWGYGIVAGAQVLLAVAFGVRVNAWGDRRNSEATDRPERAKVSSRATLSIPAVWVGAASFAVYVAIEIAAGLWAFLLLTEGRGVDPAVAGVCVSAYWGSLFVGRLVFGLVSERFGSRVVLIGCLCGMAVGALLVAVPAPAAVTVAGLMLVGFAAAPVFPLMTLTTSDRVGAEHADRTIGLQIGAAGLGGALIPAGIGKILEEYGAQWLGLTLLVGALLLIVLYLVSNPRRPAPARG